MGRDRKSNPRTMRRQFLVLCEGETEEAYVFFLKQRYRLPIKIVSKIIGSKISQRLIDRHKKELASDPSEIKVFLMYDGDVPDVLESLKACDGVMLVSKPCIEIWFMAHYMQIPDTELASDTSVRNLRLIPDWDTYKKGMLTIRQQDSLWDNRMRAVENTKNKTESNKTYSTIYQFINILETEKNRNN